MLKKSIIIISLLIIGLFQLIKYENNKIVIKGDNGYIGYLIIDKINMNLGFYDINDNKNNVDYNIEVLPNSKEGSLFIAGHSGVGDKSYFNNLVYLEVNDLIKIDYNDNNYLYEITDIYLEKKDGNISVKKKKDEKILVLTTCSQSKKGYQLVIKAVLK